VGLADNGFLSTSFFSVTGLFEVVEGGARDTAEVGRAVATFLMGS